MINEGHQDHPPNKRSPETVMPPVLANRWIRFLRNYGPIPTNDNMYDESIQRVKRPPKEPDRVYPLAKNREYDCVYDWEHRAS